MSSNKSKTKSENKTEKSLAAEKEQFSKLQLHSITKTITSSETTLKEKYARNIILGTHKEAGAATFWSYMVNLPLSSNAIVSWKFCYMLHKMLRDGHPNVVRDSQRFCRNVKDMGVLWGNLHDRYGHIVALSAKFLVLKMEFHVKHKPIPGNLEASDETVEREAGTDVKVLDMTHELLDYMDAGLKMAETVLRQLDANAAKSNTPAGQCRLGPLIPLILDSSLLYHHTVRLLFKLHSRVAADSLLGHRERFRDQFNSLTKFFDRAREMEFFKSVIQIPDLPESPPNFLRASALAEYVRPVVVMPNQEMYEVEEAELQQVPQQVPQYAMFSQMDPPDAGFEQRAPSPLPPLPSHRESEVDSLRKELEVIKPELQFIKSEAQRCVLQLKAQVNHLEAELDEQRTHKQMALVDNEQLRMEVGVLRTATAATAGIHAGYQEADGRAQAAELRFSQLKERHAELVTSHADLQRKNAETVRLLSSTQHSQEDLIRGKHQLASEVDHFRQENLLKMEQQRQEIERLNAELLEQSAQLAHIHNSLSSTEATGSQMSSALAGLQAEREVLLRSSREKEAELSSLRQQAQIQQSSLDQDRQRNSREMEALRAQLQQQLAINAEQRLEIDRLNRELEQRRAEVSHANSALQNKEMTGSQMSSALAGLQAEREVLLRSSREKEAELSSLRQQAQIQQNSLDQDRQRNSREMEALRAQLQQQACREGELTQKLQEEQFCLLQCAVVEAEGIVLDAVAKLDDPVHVRCTSSPEYLVNRGQVTLASIDKMQQSQLVYMSKMDDASGLLRAVTQFSHLAADTIVNGGATAHAAPTDQADRLTDSCRDCATHVLQYLKELKLRATLQRADPAAIRYTVQRLLTMGQELQPKGRDVLKEELGDVVDKEMAATSSAIEDAVVRMDEILSQARRETTGMKLEVNQSILGSCSDLMKAVHMLVTASTALQKDIVEGGRGVGSVKDFYAKNSCWTEGLISASKAVGWGATQLLDSADRVVTDGGKYEELIVCSHEIAANTAQLVAASKVKADRNNKRLVTLQQASRHVTDMTAVVVSSTKHGQQRFTGRGSMDFSGLSQIKLKKEEMESQVRVLELETQLEQERVRLGELRKKHYDMNGSPEGPTEGGGEVAKEDDSFPPPPPPTLLPPSTPPPQTYSQPEPYVNTNPFASPPTQSYTVPQSYTPSPSYTQPQSYSQSQSYLPDQTYSQTPPYSQTPTQSYVQPQSFSETQPYSQTQPQSQPWLQVQSQTQTKLTPINSPQPSRAQTQSYIQPQSFSETQLYSQTQPFSQPQPQPQSQSWLQTQPQTQPKLTPINSPQPSRAQTQSYLQPQPYSQTQPFSQPQPQSQPWLQVQPQPQVQPQLPPTSSPQPPRAGASKRPSIFHKTENLLKNAFRRGEAGTGES